MKEIFSSPFFLLVVRDLKVRYIASYLGIMWAFVQPIVTVLIFWFVFSIGFKVRPVSEVPFILWLLPGYLAWQYFAEAVSGATQSIVESSYLVKKIVFKVELLPIVKMMTALIVHIFFLLVMMLMYVAMGQTLTVSCLQLVYYLGALMSFVYGLSLLTSALSVFTRDIGQIVGMVMQFGFWGTPIFWDVNMLPEHYRWIIELNPLFYIVEGYRLSLLGGYCFWQRPLTLWYWLVTLLLIKFGQVVFNRLRPHFPDVL